MKELFNQNTPTRKCAYCNEMFSITKDNVNDVIFFDKKYYHLNHFVDMCNKKIKNPKSSSKWTNVLNDIETIKNDTVIALNDYFVKDDIYRHMIKSYDIQIVSPRIFQKLSAIYSGSFNGMSIPIPPNHLYDMWKQKQSYLNKVANQKKSIGKEMAKEQRILYDLSVLINKYDSYLEWINKQEILEKNNDSNYKDKFCNYNLSDINPTNKRNEITNDNMDDVLDEIFN